MNEIFYTVGSKSKSQNHSSAPTYLQFNSRLHTTLTFQVQFVVTLAAVSVFALSAPLAGHLGLALHAVHARLDGLLQRGQQLFELLATQNTAHECLKSKVSESIISFNV